MFSIFKKKNKGSVITFKIDGMHCTSCGMSIDGELEDTPGVLSASTKYASGETTIEYDEKKVSLDSLKTVITQLGYKVR